jgi:hypothetical protein
MPRKIRVSHPDHGSALLSEIAAHNEEQLQELIKNDPDLLPVEEFGMTGPLLVIGRETNLPSGAVDLVALARSGEILIVEFKTGPQNTDFRHVIAQLIDYGSDMWGMPLENFEQTVPKRFFESSWCNDDRYRGLPSLEDAMEVAWQDLNDAEAAKIRSDIEQQLQSGSFSYVVVAQRFTPATERSVDYLNGVSKARFFAVELVRFEADEWSAFEARTVLKPGRAPPATARTNRGGLLDAIQDTAYRECLEQLLEVCEGLGFRFEWGSAGVSIRLPTLDMSEPLTIGWIFPPGKPGWMNLSDITLGFDENSAAKRPSVQGALERYLGGLLELRDVERVARGPVRAVRLRPGTAIALRAQVSEILASLVEASNQTST